MTGTVTRDGQPVSEGRVGGWQLRKKELDRVNVTVRRGRTVPRHAFESTRSRIGPGGTFRLDDLKPGVWFFRFESPGAAPTVVGPVELKEGGDTRSVAIATVAGGSISGCVENLPPRMSGMAWVVAFDGTIVRREARIAPDGTFRLDDLPPGRYGLKAGHDAYKDPHIPQGNLAPEEYRKPAEPWQGAVIVTVAPGATTRDVLLDFRPPAPLVDPEPDKKEEAPPR